jgi:predicted acylesterase/phospholipase RssA
VPPGAGRGPPRLARPRYDRAGMGTALAPALVAHAAATPESMALAPVDTALILPGGGARAAYQVGALRALARLTPRGRPLPFPVLCGTSAGAINAVTLAAHADDFRLGVARLVRWWRRVRTGDVYDTDLAQLSRHGMRWLAGVLTGRPGPDEAGR